MGLKAFFKHLWGVKTSEEETIDPMKKFLIVGLGNIGVKYDHTRHNVGFEVVDALADKFDVSFEPVRFGHMAKFRHKGRLFMLLKPDTFMNLSGKAVRFWMTKEKLLLENLLIVGDDIALDFGTIRLRKKGSAAGHNGFQNVQDLLNTPAYARLRFGVGNDFPKGGQVDYVLGQWKEEEQDLLPERLKQAAEACLSFGMSGINQTMSDFNGK